ncbi:MAG TPA: ComEC/Rec2 family competence protein [Thermodesulfobacteriota bacterium]|nr:ComEC/Rec2 family competence protein [Thermodesulfobacteriota bacterium]
MIRPDKNALRRFSYGFPIIPSLAGLVFGILLAGYFQNPWPWIVILAPLSGAAALFVPPLRFLLLVPVGMVLAAPAPYHPVDTIESCAGRKVDVGGSLYSSPEKRERGSRMFIDVDYVIEDGVVKPATGRTAIYSDTLAPGLSYGDSVRVIGVKLRPIENFRNPGAFDMKAHFGRQGIYTTGYVEGAERIISFGRGEDYGPVLHGLDRLRHRYGNFVRSNFRQPASEVLNALTIGEDGGIPNELRAEFSKSGVAHVLSISGLHVAAVAVVFFFLFKWLLKRSEYVMLRWSVSRIAAALTILPLFFYMALAGFSTPTVRAFIMISIFLVAIIAGKNENKINTLGVAAFVILLVRPEALFDLSFRLSFLAVLGILLVNRFYPFGLGTTRDFVLTTVKTTCAATFATLPLVLNSFGVLPVVSIPANLIFVPLVELLIVPLGLVSFALFLLSPYVASLFIWLNMLFTEMMVFGIGLFLKIPYSSVSVRPLGAVQLTLYAALGVAALLAARRARARYAVPVLAILFLISAAWPAVSRHFGGGVTVTFLDTGRDRSTVLFELPGGRNVLVSGGPAKPAGSGFIDSAVIGGFLHGRGVNTIDCLVLTSPGKDVLGGGAYIVENFGVGKVVTDGDRLEGALWEAIRESGAEWENLRSIGEIDVPGGYSISVMRPEGWEAVEDSAGPRPLALRLEAAGASFLLAESLDGEDGRSLGEIYGGEIESTVLFIPGTPDGGSGTVLAGQVKPRILITEGGESAAPESPKTYSITEDGAVTVTADGDAITVKSYEDERALRLE